MTTSTIRGLIAWTLAMTALAVALAWVLYLARGVLLLVYVSVLLAIGFGPIVRAIERKRAVGPRRLPRWFAILVVYLVIVGVLTITGFLVIPPLIDQTQELSTRLPDLLDKAQDFLIRHGVISHTITLEEAVRMLTFDNASAWELEGRGLIRTGYAADIVVFDDEHIRPRLPTVEEDLPGGARRLVQKADGIAATIVNGGLALENGEPTGAYAGTVLKGRLAAG